MPKSDRRLIVVDDETWRAFLLWGARHNVARYRGRLTVAGVTRALLLAVEKRERAKRRPPS